MRLVSKGQEEFVGCEKTKNVLLNQAKIDGEMYSKEFLQEAQSTINQVLERPPVDPINPKEDTLHFMCTDIDTYADKPPKYMTAGSDLSNMA